MGSVDFLNLEYLLLRVYRLFAGESIEFSAVGDFFLSFWTQLSIVGLSLAFLIFVLTVWFRIKLEIVEHEYHAQVHAALSHRPRREEGSRGDPRWGRIEALASSKSDSDWRRAVLDADAMLGEVLGERGYVGEGVGEQLRGANPLQFRTLDLAWRAHKVRNEAAHRSDFRLSERETRATLDLYRRVFEEFEVI